LAVKGIQYSSRDSGCAGEAKARLMVVSSHNTGVCPKPMLLRG